MAMIQCPECKKAISDTAESCPKCGYKLTENKRTELKQKAKQGKQMLILFGAALFVLILICSFSGNKEKSKTPSKSETQNTSTKEIPYKVMREHLNMGMGLFEKVILIDSQYRNENDLRALGENLRYEARAEREVHVAVFDNLKASGIVVKVAAMIKLGKREAVFYDSHHVADYDKNGTNGHNHFAIMLDTTSSGYITIDYPPDTSGLNLNIVYNDELDGSVHQVRDYIRGTIRETLRDPGSLQIDSWYRVVHLQNGGFTVKCKIRSKNEFGGYAVAYPVFTLDAVGNVIKVDELDWE